MKTLTLTVPDTLDLNARDFALLVSTRLYEQGKLSLGRAAELAGLSKRAFAELLGSYDVSLLNYPATDFASDVANAQPDYLGCQLPYRAEQHRRASAFAANVWQHFTTPEIATEYGEPLPHWVAIQSVQDKQK